MHYRCVDEPSSSWFTFYEFGVDVINIALGGLCDERLGIDFCAKSGQQWFL